MTAMPLKVEAEQAIATFAAETGRPFAFADLMAWSLQAGLPVSEGRLRAALVTSGNKASSGIVRLRHGVYVHKGHLADEVSVAGRGHEKNTLHRAIITFARVHDIPFGHNDLCAGLRLRGGTWSRTNTSSALIALANDDTAPITRLDRGLYAHTGVTARQEPEVLPAGGADLLVTALLPPTGYTDFLTVKSMEEQIEFFIEAWAMNYDNLELTPIHAYLWLCGWYEGGVDAAAVMTGFQGCEHMLAQVRPGVFTVAPAANVDPTPSDPSAKSDNPDSDTPVAPVRAVCSDRDRKIADRRLDGHALDAIGAEFGLTRERVRQITFSQGVTNDKARQGKADRIAADNRALTQRVVNHFRHNNHQSLTEVAEALSLPLDTLRGSVPRRVVMLIGQVNGWTVRQFTDADITQALGAAAILLGEPLTAKAYQRAVMDGRIVGPSVPLLHVRYGTWVKACKLAGVTPGTPPPNRTYETRWTDEDMVSIAVEFLRVAPIPTYSHFEEWLGGRGEYPSGALMRIRLGGWSDIRALALHELAADDTFWDSLMNTPVVIVDPLAITVTGGADDTPDPMIVLAGGEPDALLASLDFTYLNK